MPERPSSAAEAAVSQSPDPISLGMGDSNDTPELDFIEVAPLLPPLRRPPRVNFSKIKRPGPEDAGSSSPKPNPKVTEKEQGTGKGKQPKSSEKGTPTTPRKQKSGVATQPKSKASPAVGAGSTPGREPQTPLGKETAKVNGSIKGRDPAKSTKTDNALSLRESHTPEPRTPKRATNTTPARKTPSKATPATTKTKTTLATSTTKLLPTPSSSRSRTKTGSTAKPSGSASKPRQSQVTPRKGAQNRDDEIDFSMYEEDDNDSEGDPFDVAVSRETFLANEALRRQREARNFLYKGDSDAPRLTRSGRVVGDSSRRDEEDDDQDEENKAVDEYGGTVLDGEDMGMDLDLDLNADVGETPTEEISQGNHSRVHTDHQPEPIPVRVANYRQPEPIKEISGVEEKINPLPAVARPHVIDILATLTSRRSVEYDSSDGEEKNDAMHGLLKLLQGTVDRGEGNSALMTGARGVGKTRAVNRALNKLSSGSTNSPIVVRLSGLAQTNDRLAIREMGRQIAQAEGRKSSEEDDEEQMDGVEEEYAPTTLPSHLLALLTAPSARAIIIVIDEFDLFTEHARQALLYCLLDVVQSVKTGPVESTGRGIAVIGVTSRVDTLLLLEKRVKSRFSHRMFRVVSPLAPEGVGWPKLLQRALTPWTGEAIGSSEVNNNNGEVSEDDEALTTWREDWEFAVDMLFKQAKFKKAMDRLSGLTTDVRVIYRPFVVLMTAVLHSKIDFLDVPAVSTQLLGQVELAGWGLQTAKLKGLPQPALAILIIAKHLHYAGREEFNFAQIEEEYLRFARTKLVGSGKTRWPIGILRMAYSHLLHTSLLSPAAPSATNLHSRSRFTKVRCTLSPHEIVAFFRESGGVALGPELTSWGRIMGGHA